MKAIFTLITILILGLTISAQRKPSSKPSQPIIETDGTTKDGKAVVLRSDGTWKFDDRQTPTAAGRLVDFQAAVIFKSGEVVPVPRANFYLLDTNLQDVLATEVNRQILISDIRARAPKPNDELTEMMVSEYQKMTLKGFIKNAVGLTLSQNYVDITRPLILKAAKFTVMTDFQGNGSFRDVPPGKYFLFGHTEMRKNFIVWHVEISVDKSDQKIILDTNNSLQ
jgi:hypothetical protein